MKLIIGLGNFGKQYQHTRHNIGFAAIDSFANLKNLKFKKNAKINGLIAKENDYLLIKPLTFMNLSGDCFAKVINFFKIKLADVLVIYDDKDLNVGQLRIRTKGSAGGQNGMKDIIRHAKTDEIKRVRFGIGEPHIPLAAFVLSKFSDNEISIVKKSLLKVNNIIEEFINNVEFDKIMSNHNG